MKLTIELDVGDNVNEMAFAQAMQWLKRIVVGDATPLPLPESLILDPRPVPPEQILDNATAPTTEEQQSPAKRGRKSTAQKAAEAAAAGTGTPPGIVAGATPGSGNGVTEPAVRVAGGAAAPFGTPPPFEAASVEPIAPAMPKVNATPVAVGEGMTLEDFRALCVQANGIKPGIPFQVFRRPTWKDGTPKASWMVADNVPAEFRERLIADIQAELGS